MAASSAAIFYYTNELLKANERILVSRGSVSNENGQAAVEHIMTERLPQLEAKSLSILFLGDVMLGRDVARKSSIAGTVEYPFEHFNALLGVVAQHPDLIVANLEGPITTSRAVYQKSISFAFAPEVATVLKKYNFSLLNLANNHGYDR